MRIWTPPKQRIESSNLVDYLRYLREAHHADFTSFGELYNWSIQESEEFWESIWNYCDILHDNQPNSVLNQPGSLLEAEWFPGATLNFAENLLRTDEEKPAIVFWGERSVRRTLSYPQLRDLVSKLATYFRQNGVKSGDRIAAFLPNIPEAVAGVLAAASIGAVWTSCSPDFGVSGVLDRFGQIEPSILIVADGYVYKGAAIDSLSKAKEIARQIPSIKRVLVVPYLSHHPEIGFDADLLDDLQSPTAPLKCANLPFNHPLYIMYSSGTTGSPKCIVHGAGGTLLEHRKELVLHTDLKSEDRIFYQTTTGWMMWNWLVSALSQGSTIVLYDGFPLLDSGKILFDLAEEEKVSIFGTSAKWLALIEKEGLTPKKSHELSNLRTILSTGSPLAPESFDFVYKSIKKDLCLSSIAGGTDIIGCFGLGCPVLPVYRGELQCRSLGYNVQVYDASGKSITREKGELVCTAPFPSMPLRFWNDPQKARYKKAYFEKFPGVWHHGDFVELTEHGGLIFHGRSDTVLNPGGVRIGTAEIYRQVEKLPEILECVAVGQDWEGDVRVILFVKLRPGFTLDQEMSDRIKLQIRENASPFHVPKKILQAVDIPRTRSGKITESAVREMVHGRTVTNLDALANPEALEYFRGRKELSEA
ncbi:MAG: acetoacetate--CoA ligase [Bdellovibrionales bacterium]|nr:acetoacetate--CoA ligase [Bdellovibrionales bacterium]